MSAARSGARRRLVAVSYARTTDHARNQLRRVQQGLRSQVGVPKEALGHVKRNTLVHQEAGERTAHTTQPDVGQSGAIVRGAALPSSRARQ